MEVKFLQRNIFKRIFGIPATSKPDNPDCWSYSDGKLTIDLRKASELEKPGSAIRLEGGSLPERLLVVFGEDEQYHVVKNRCSHMGHRRLDPVPGTTTVQCCSVNKSTYDFEGTKVYGPAPDPITTYPASLDGDQIISTIRE
jgi:nitrite reductase/ring-hydroxylating ferredoxin subunit